MAAWQPPCWGWPRQREGPATVSRLGALEPLPLTAKKTKTFACVFLYGHVVSINFSCYLSPKHGSHLPSPSPGICEVLVSCVPLVKWLLPGRLEVDGVDKDGPSVVSDASYKYTRQLVKVKSTLQSFWGRGDMALVGNFLPPGNISLIFPSVALDTFWLTIFLTASGPLLKASSSSSAPNVPLITWPKSGSQMKTET